MIFRAKEIAEAMESRGYASMVNAKSIGELIDRLEALEHKLTTEAK